MCFAKFSIAFPNNATGYGYELGHLACRDLDFCTEKRYLGLGSEYMFASAIPIPFPLKSQRKYHYVVVY
jgi:hypothetical protein